MAMGLERKQDLSIYYWLVGLFAPISSSIKIEDGFPGDKLTLPTISIEGDNIRLRPLELGNRRGKRQRIWTIDVFAKNKAQRDEMTTTVLDDIETGIVVYDYDQGFPPISVPQIGTLLPFDIDVSTVRMFDQMMENLYWRNAIRFLSEYSSTI
jgi:hypothetical protein